MPRWELTPKGEVALLKEAQQAQTLRGAFVLRADAVRIEVKAISDDAVILGFYAVADDVEIATFPIEHIALKVNETITIGRTNFSVPIHITSEPDAD